MCPTYKDCTGLDLSNEKAMVTSLLFGHQKYSVYNIQSILWRDLLYHFGEEKRCNIEGSHVSGFVTLLPSFNPLAPELDI
jgi:hypothetical protein